LMRSIRIRKILLGHNYTNNYFRHLRVYLLF
jgi:hypothetical protein